MLRFRQRDGRDGVTAQGTEGDGVQPLYHLRGEEKEHVERSNKRFNEELNRQITGQLSQGHIYNLGRASSILQSAGFPDADIELSSTRLAEKARQHSFRIEDVRNLVSALQEPVAVFSYGDKTKAQNVIAEIVRDGKNFVVGVHFNQSRHGAEVSDIRGLFPKDNAEWLNWVSQGKLLYVDKEKIQTLIDQQRTNPAEVDYLDLEDVAKIIKDFENPSVLSENNSKTTESGGDLLSRAKELLAELHRRGLTNFTLSESKSNGNSVYVEDLETGTKFRLSDHSVTSNARVKNEIHVTANDNVSELADIAEQRQRAYDERVKSFDQQKARVDELRTYWDGIQDRFAGDTFVSMSRTYQDLDTIRNKHPEARDIRQVDLGGGAYSYEWHEPIKANSVPSKPSIEYMDWYRTKDGGVRFRVVRELDNVRDELNEKGISIDDKGLLEKYGLKNVTLSKRRNHVTLTHFIAAEHGMGNGTRFMEDLVKMADENGWTLALTPDISFGGTSVRRLKDFYKRFGFVDNTGSHRDFETRESMIRRPVEKSEREVMNVIIESAKYPRTKEAVIAQTPAGGKLCHNEDQDVDVRVGRNTIRHALMHGTPDEIAAMGGIDEIIAEAVKIGNIPVAEDELGHTRSVSIYYTPVSVDGRQYSARMVIKELENRGRVLDELSLYHVAMIKQRTPTA